MFTSSRYGEALVWTEQLHRNQCRKGKDVPYISHLLAVSSLVWEDDGTEDQAIAALLHDCMGGRVLITHQPETIFKTGR